MSLFGDIWILPTLIIQRGLRTNLISDEIGNLIMVIIEIIFLVRGHLNQLIFTLIFGNISDHFNWFHQSGRMLILSESIKIYLRKIDFKIIWTSKEVSMTRKNIELKIFNLSKIFLDWYDFIFEIILFSVQEANILNILPGFRIWDYAKSGQILHVFFLEIFQE